MDRRCRLGAQVARGLIAITGETGAGKSLISSALGLAAGGRVRGADVVGSKGTTARVELELDLGEAHQSYTREVRTGGAIPCPRLGECLLPVDCCACVPGECISLPRPGCTLGRWARQEGGHWCLAGEEALDLWIFWGAWRARAPRWPEPEPGRAAPVAAGQWRGRTVAEA